MLAHIQRGILLAEALFYAAFVAICWAFGVGASGILAGCLLLAGSGRLLWIVAPRLWLAETPTPRGPWLRSLAMEWLAFTLTHSALQPARPLWRRWLSEPPHRGTVDVLFVHGYCCNAAYWLPLAWRLRNSAVRAWFVDLEPPFASIDQLATRLAARITRIRSELRTPLIIVAHSMGGLVARAALRNQPDLPVSELITLGTPHEGTIIAHMSSAQPARDMRPASAFLGSLPPGLRQSRVIAVASIADGLVTPPTTALPAWADERITLGAVGHHALGWHRETVRLIQRSAAGLERLPTPRTP